jgi:hypothetical protein
MLVVRLWINNYKKTTDIKVMLLGPTESHKTQFFTNIDTSIANFSVSNELSCKQALRKSDIQSNLNSYDIHRDETKNGRTLKLHHKYTNYMENKNSVGSLSHAPDSRRNITKFHFIDTPGNSIISNTKYLVSYNIDIILYFEKENDNSYTNIINEFNKKFNNVIFIKDAKSLNIFETIIDKYNNNSRKNILVNMNDIILINENKLINNYYTSSNKYISYCYNFMPLEIFKNYGKCLSDPGLSSVCYIKNLQHRYKYINKIDKNNIVAIETTNIMYKSIIGDTIILNNYVIDDIELEEINKKCLNDTYLKTFYFIILNQIYLFTDKTLPKKIIFDKLIFIPKTFTKIPIIIILKNDSNFDTVVCNITPFNIDTS